MIRHLGPKPLKAPTRLACAALALGLCLGSLSPVSASPRLQDRGGRLDLYADRVRYRRNDRMGSRTAFPRWRHLGLSLGRRNQMLLRADTGSLKHMLDIIPIAHETYQIWRAAGFSHEQACGGPVGGQQRETGFRIPIIGDKRGTDPQGWAYAAFQWHKPRRDAIKDALGIDLMNPACTNADMQRAALWEINQHVFHVFLANLKAAKTVEQAATTWVVDYERSLNHASDIFKQTAFGLTWAHLFAEHIV